MKANLKNIKSYFIPHRILDIGANKGQWHTYAKGIFPNSLIFSIEAEIQCEPFLKKITSDYHIGLLAKDTRNYDFYTLKNNPINTGNSIYKELGEHYTDENTVIETLKGERLDDLFDKNAVFDLIKIDTQGSELDIISGGINICKRSKGMLLEVSLTQCNQNAPLYDNVVEFMNNIGFKKSEILDESIYKNYHQQDILFINTCI